MTTWAEIEALTQRYQADLADMYATSALADISGVALNTLEGQKAAALVLKEVASGTSSPDALQAAALAVLAQREPERLRAFFRAVQKRLEAASA